MSPVCLAHVACLLESAFASLSYTGKRQNEVKQLFGGTSRTVSFTYDTAGFLTSTSYPDGTTTIDRTNDWRGRIDTLSPSSTELVDYAYIGARVAQRSYDVPSVDYAASYDNLGRVTEMDYGAY